MIKTEFEVIIIGGSFAGLSAAMTLARSLRRILIIDSGKPCNRQTPHAHNLITQDGAKPSEITASAKDQVMKYPTVSFVNDLAVSFSGKDMSFEVGTQSGKKYTSQKLLLATGVKDLMPEIDGFAECWGISVLHCPYCHGYEVHSGLLGVIGNGELGFHMAGLIHHWSKDLCLFTNGASELTDQQTDKLYSKGIKIIEKEISGLDHTDGRIKNLVFKDGSPHPVQALFTRVPFTQHCEIPILAGCKLTDEGLIDVDDVKKTSIPGIFAAGDNTTTGRSLSVAIAAGTVAGAFINKELIDASF